MDSAPAVLLVEPSLLLRSVLNRWLENVLAHYLILNAANGSEAIGLAVDEHPSYVLIELDLPEKTGFEVLGQLRQILPTARIVATGWYEGRWFFQRVRAAGADGFISKDKLHRELLPTWEISIDNGKISAHTDH
jgi:two-component system chemotaxis response regulator CheY